MEELRDDLAIIRCACLSWTLKYSYAQWKLKLSHENYNRIIRQAVSQLLDQSPPQNTAWRWLCSFWSPFSTNIASRDSCENFLHAFFGFVTLLVQWCGQSKCIILTTEKCLNWTVTKLHGLGYLLFMYLHSKVVMEIISLFNNQEELKESQQCV